MNAWRWTRSGGATVQMGSGGATVQMGSGGATVQMGSGGATVQMGSGGATVGPDGSGGAAVQTGRVGLRSRRVVFSASLFWRRENPFVMLSGFSVLFLGSMVGL